MNNSPTLYVNFFIHLLVCVISKTQGDIDTSTGTKQSLI